jgi:hypothetical protein
MKTLTYLFLAILIVACSDDDSSEQLFLEKYDSVVWEYFEDDGEADWEKIAFINNSKALTIYTDGICFTFNLEGTTETPDGDTVTISIQNETENSLTIIGQSQLYPEDNGLNIFTVTSDGSTYTLTRGDGNNVGDDRIYIRTDDEVCF